MLNRRNFIQQAAGTALAVSGLNSISSAQTAIPRIRLGAPVDSHDPDSFVKAHQDAGYRAAYWPTFNRPADDALINAYIEAAQKADIVFAEVGAWSNPIDPNDTKRKQALAHCKKQLALADRVGARCCVNISGSRNPEKWDSHHPDNLTEDTFDLIVQSVRDIIDDAKPTRTFYTLETMPWAFPDSADSYLRLLKAIDRKQFAAHFDPTNLIYSPQLYYSTDKVLREFFEKLGPYIKSCHAKDIILEAEFMTHLSETMPGKGNLDYKVFLTELSKLPDVPLMLEHLKTPDEYRQAAEYIRSAGKEAGISLS
jgi:sugar phosphate isomerase/epimerase